MARCLLILTLPALLTGCEWADQKLKQRKERQTFHKRIVWNKSERFNCPKEYYIQKFRRRQGSDFVNILASAGSCTLFFQFVQTITEKETITYELNKAIITTSNTESFIFTDVIPLRFADIGWGYRIEWAFNYAGNDYSFKLYMRPGTYEDPFLPED